MTRMLVAATAASVLAAGTGLSAGASLRPTAPDTTARAALFTTVKVTEKEYKITLSKKTAKRGLVIFKVKNVGSGATRLPDQRTEDAADLAREVRHPADDLPEERRTTPTCASSRAMRHLG